MMATIDSRPSALLLEMATRPVDHHEAGVGLGPFLEHDVVAHQRTAARRPRPAVRGRRRRSGRTARRRGAGGTHRLVSIVGCSLGGAPAPRSTGRQRCGDGYRAPVWAQPTRPRPPATVRGPCGAWWWPRGPAAASAGPSSSRSWPAARVLDRSVATAAEVCDGVVVVLAPDVVDSAEGRVPGATAVVAGGATRTESGRAGLRRGAPRGRGDAGPRRGPAPGGRGPVHSGDRRRA